MQHRLLAGLMLLAAPVLAAPPAHAATVKQGPAGTKFYTPPKTLPAGSHGTPIWQRKLTGKAVLKSAKANTLLLYRSTSVAGKTIAVSGTVAVPKGKAPKAGWPVITWAHGTVGIADACAPSRVGMQANYDSPLLNDWLKAGYAVVRTDYEGLGTPGEHPYLIGTSEGRSVLDMARAARKLDSSLGKRVLIAGHSQGGQAALFASALAKQWAPDLTLRGTLAFAPVSHLSTQAAAIRGVTTAGGISGLAAMIIRGIDIANPGLKISKLLGDRAKTLYPQLDKRCLDGINKSDSFGAIAPADLFRSDVNLDPIVAALREDADPDALKVPGPVLIEQGKADTTVFGLLTDQLVGELKTNGADVTYKTYENVNHGGAVTDKAPATDAKSWVKKRF
jgi:pimeloyl-ACP methyl ester carboxylesterase